MKRSHALAAVVVLLSAVWLWKARSRSLPTSVSDRSRLAPAPATAVALTPLEKKVGLRKSRLAHDGRNTFLNVSVNVVKRCEPGDFDAIKLDLAHAEPKRLLLSIEQVTRGDGKFTPIVSEISQDDLERSFTRRFSLPTASAKNKALALYLCRDSRRESRCAGKAVADVNAIIARNVQPAKQPTTDPGEDHVYYFQFLRIDDASELAVFERPIPTRTAFDALPEYLAQGTGKGTAQFAGPASVVRRNMTTIMSLPIAGAGIFQRIDLPTFDRAKCLGASPIK